MTDDIVSRLHDWQAIVDESKGEAVVLMLSGRVFGEAAAEIERLSGVITEWIDAYEDPSSDNYGEKVTALYEAVGR